MTPPPHAAADTGPSPAASDPQGPPTPDTTDVSSIDTMTETAATDATSDGTQDGRQDGDQDGRQDRSSDRDDGRRSSSRGEYDHLMPKLAEHAAHEVGSPERQRLRDELVRGHLPVAQHIARRFSRRGEPEEDLEQVATLGLINAVDRYDPARGTDFLSYAVPTITGEVRRHFRDQAWSMRVPRRLKDLNVTLSSAMSQMSQTLGRAPNAAELAEHLGIAKEEVLEALEASNAYRSGSLDEMLVDDPDSGTVSDLLGEADAALEQVEYQQSLAPLLEKLPQRERTIIMLRFFKNMTQSQIAERVGISQMHVSRLLAKTLAQLRDGLGDAR
ncbi:RNA polymerase sigma-28 (SigD/FliA/WhiG) subunit [Actinomycetospora cinnamomea]|uniref:RNA polymerase sigma-28 (SigD/FliA/WhiG) subunit n=2 Tax=Actinomycetospora cinnamomea TaxID=663609 RepID=A0A2U1F7W7_9PSEU|nr:RNA polymerase sigma-28 (SigD/FliA/WhiG) subunit [Actinomycetospora cinnamomea]